MKIYVGHSSDLDYEKLYSFLRESDLDEEHEIILPHRDSNEPFDSRTYLKEECDLFVAEVSKPSTGLGIELGWADIFKVPVLCVHREDAEISGSVHVVADEVKSYGAEEELPDLIKDEVNSR